MEIMEQKDSMIQIQSQNHGQLLSGVETIMQKLDMPHQQQLALLDRDLGSPKGIMDCTAAAQVLQEKMDAELLPGLCFFKDLQLLKANLWNKILQICGHYEQVYS